MKSILSHEVTQDLLLRLLICYHRIVRCRLGECTSQRHVPWNLDIHHFLCPFIFNFEPLSSRPDTIILSTTLNLIVSVFPHDVIQRHPQACLFPHTLCHLRSNKKISAVISECSKTQRIVSSYFPFFLATFVVESLLLPAKPCPLFARLQE